MSFLKQYKSLWPGIAALILLVVCRMGYTHSYRFAFLYWNFFLALLPLYFSHKVKHSLKPVATCAFAALWLLFFPNAAYLFTDIVHLKAGTRLMYWLDVIILFSSGIYGLVIAMYSLREMEAWYGQFVSARLKKGITCCLLLLCGYGIYLGRVERWNSWDILAQPGDLFQAMHFHARHPFRSRVAWYMTSVFAAGLQIIYSLFSRANTGIDANPVK